ncbi:class I SAM-dependent methyltransferase [Litorivicinus sp.]|nr:class I SAM-dependent methyltransferase [Litorivicinus sp.]
MKIDCCPACQSKNIAELLQLDSERLQRFSEYSLKFYGGLLDAWLGDIPPVVMRCDVCSHVFYGVIPSSDQLGEMYGSLRRSQGSPDPARPPSQHMINEMKKLYSLSQLSSPTFLDYGAGYGRWSHAAAQVGFSVVSFEPHATRSTENTSYPVIHERNKLNGRIFDFIWLEQVLEHVTDPLGVLCDIKSLMSPSTILSISVPNIERSAEGSDIWKTWPYDGTRSHTLAPFQHLHGFSQRSLFTLLHRAGFKPLQGINIWRFYTWHQLRVLMGALVPRLSTTRCYLTLA